MIVAKVGQPIGITLAQQVLDEQREVGQIHLPHRQRAPLLLKLQQLLDAVCDGGIFGRSQFGQEHDPAETSFAAHAVQISAEFRDGFLGALSALFQGGAGGDLAQPPFGAGLTAIRDRKFDGYADSRLGEVPVNFLSTCDTTGGNSGSPTLNANGELTGLLFDGNYEALGSDFVVDPKLTRSIHVDAMYMLWVMDAVDGAHNLLREMGLVPHFGDAAVTGSR